MVGIISITIYISEFGLFIRYNVLGSDPGGFCYVST